MHRPIRPFLICLGVVVLATGTSVVAIRRGTERQVRPERDESPVREPAPDRPADPSRVATAPEDAWQDEMDTLRRDIEALRSQVAALPPAVSTPPPVTRSALATTPRPDNPWDNAGRGAPLATFRTVQWAIHEGEVDTLEAAIILDAAAQEAAEAFFANLDEQSRADFGSPHRLVASVMAAKSYADLSSAEMVAESPAADGTSELRLRIAGTRTKAREINLRFEPSADGWRLRVPAKIVTSYRNLLLGPIVDPSTYQVVR